MEPVSIPAPRRQHTHKKHALAAPAARSIDGLLFLNCLFQLTLSCIGELFSDGGSTVTPDVTESEL